MGKPEALIEKYLAKSCKERGILCYKFTSPGRNGVPDRMVIGYGQCVFIEVKRESVDKLDRLQEVTCNEMRHHGAIVYKANSKEAVDEILNNMERSQ